MAGRRMDDHSFWAGGHSKGSVFPEGAKTKDETTASSVGEVMFYRDTTEAIKMQQDKGSKKVKGHAQDLINRY